MKVLLVDPGNFTPHYNGALANALLQTGAEVEIATSSRNLPLSEVYYAGLRVRHVFPGAPQALARPRLRSLRRFMKGLAYPVGAGHLASGIGASRPDIVHLQWSLVPPVDLLLINYLHLRRVATVLTVHDVEPVWPIPAASLQRRVFEAVGRIVVHSPALADQFAQKYRLARGDSIRVIPHGTFLPARDLTADDRLSARRNLHVPETARVVLFFGELKPYKGVPLLVEALAAAAGKIPGLFFLLAGHPDTPADVPTLSALTVARVPYATDFRYIPESDVWQYFAAADVVALPYLRISQSGVLFSALGYARPVVCTPVGAVAEVVAAADAGWVAKSTAVLDFADSLVEALADVAATGKRGAAAGAMARSLYAWNQIAEQTMRMYRDLLDETRCASPVTTRKNGVSGSVRAAQVAADDTQHIARTQVR